MERYGISVQTSKLTKTEGEKKKYMSKRVALTGGVGRGWRGNSASEGKVLLHSQKKNLLKENKILLGYIMSRKKKEGIVQGLA